MKTSMGNAQATVRTGHAPSIVESLGPQPRSLRPLTPLLAAAAFAVTAMTLVGSLLMG